MDLVLLQFNSINAYCFKYHQINATMKRIEEMYLKSTDKCPLQVHYLKEFVF